MLLAVCGKNYRTQSIGLHVDSTVIPAVSSQVAQLFKTEGCDWLPVTRSAPIHLWLVEDRTEYLSLPLGVQRTSTFAQPQKRLGRTEPNLKWNYSNFRNLIKWRNIVDPYVYCFNQLDLLALCYDDVFQFYSRNWQYLFIVSYFHIVSKRFAQNF